ncbi:MAG TPA: MBOAT family O-acyltransferase [Vicinamibacterales bacterium]|nr:MBOAT family O-acyltransferase [Vicinamibacterales bacterium]
MNFVSSEYALLLLVTVALALLLRGRIVTYVVLAASVIFYGWWSPVYLWLLLAVIVLSWLGALVVDRWRSRTVLTLVIVGELSLLLYFKYAGFLMANVRAASEWLGLSYVPAVPSILLPAGISFMTFQGVAYVVDVYRRELEPVRSLVDVALFKSFFPQLVAGPIERGRHLLPQLRALESGLRDRVPMARGTFMIMKGVFLKFVIADNMATIVERVYGDVAGSSPLDVALAVYGFSIQIYCDFYGYTMIALGSALLLGVQLINNFEHPYLATSIQEFWRRWHVSLSQWFRDYLYIPMGGSRVSLPRHLFNLLVVMFAVGLWHGANWTFVAWGAIHGTLLGLHVLWRRVSGRIPVRMPMMIGAALGWLVTFHAVTLAWIPFRSPDFATPALVLDKLWQWTLSPVSFDSSIYGLPFYLWLVAVFIVFEVIDGTVELDRRYAQLSIPAQAVALFAFCLATYLGPLKEVAFLYFQF